MSFAKKLARRQKKAIQVGTKRGQRNIQRTQQIVKETYVKQYRREVLMRHSALQNLSACFLLATNEKYGYGRKKLLRLKEKMQSEFDSLVAGNVSVKEIDAYLKEELQLDLEMDINPQGDRYRQINHKAVKEMSCAYFMALLDEFGFRQKRLNDAYKHAAGLSDRVRLGKITYEEIHARVKKILSRGQKVEQQAETT